MTIVADAIRALDTFTGGPAPNQVTTLLPMWRYRTDLSDGETLLVVEHYQKRGQLVDCPGCDGTASRYAGGTLVCHGTGARLDAATVAEVQSAQAVVNAIKAGQPPAEALRQADVAAKVAAGVAAGGMAVIEAAAAQPAPEATP
jgi:hypothetical protein